MADREVKPRQNSFDGDDSDEGAWIVTYADLMSLLLVFFILLFSLSSLDAQKFKLIAAQVQKSFGKPTTDIEWPNPDKDRAPEYLTAEPTIEDLARDVPEDVRAYIEEQALENIIEALDQELLDDINAFAGEQRVGDNIIVTHKGPIITITVEGRIFYDSGSSDLRTEAAPILDEIGKIIKKHAQYRVNIKGHTDDQPISTLQFPSNWELSAVRATTVLRRLIQFGINPHRLTATGYGDLLPLVPNDSPENRAKNRRVEFVLEKEKEGR